MIKKASILCIFSLCVALLAGCMQGERIKGGSLTHDNISGRTVQTQSQDPKTPSTLQTEHSTELIIPAFSKVMVGSNIITLSSNTSYRTVDKVSSVAGSAQKNTLGDTIAKLKSLAWLTYLGAALIIFGIVSAVYPPVKLLVNSLTTSLLLIVAGVAFIALPTLLVGHELAILLVGGGVVVVWYLAHKHGSISAELKTIKSIFVTNDTQPPAK